MLLPMTTEPEPISSSSGLDSSEAGARYIRGSVIRVLTYGVSLLASLVSAPLVIRHLGTAQYGYYATVTAIVFIIGGFTEGGLNTLGVREFASGRTDRDRLLRNLVGLRVTATASAVAVVAIVAAILGAAHVIVYGVLLGGTGLIVTITGENYGIPLSSELRLTAVSMLGLAQQVMLATAYIVLVVLGAHALPFLAATIASGGVLFAGTWFLVRSSVSVLPAFDRQQWHALIRQTLPYAMASAVGIIYFREALVLMSLLTSERQVSYYGAAFRIVEVLTVIPWTMISGAFPILSRAAHTENATRLRYALTRLFETAVIVGVWMTGCIVVGASFGIAVVAGPGFGPSVPVLEIQGLAVLTSFMVALFGSLLLSLKLFRALLVANALAVAAATILSLVLIPSLGARGAAIAPTVSEACLALAYAYSLRRHDSRYSVSLKLIPRIALATAVAFGITYALPLTSFEGLLVFTAAYALLLMVLRAIPFEIVNALLRRGAEEPTSAASAGTKDGPS